jgi:toxin YoeB
LPAAGVEVWWSKRAREDIAYWRKHDPSTTARIESLIEDIKRSPFRGLGKPEPLKHALAGFWSRRINKEHRLVYRVEAGVIYMRSVAFITTNDEIIGVGVI